MKLSTKGQYGLKAMISLGVYAKEDYMPLNEVAKNVDVSENYLEQLIALLRRAGYVKSRRGSQGGYKLAVDPEEISVGQILRVLEGSLAPTSCSCEDNTSKCSNHDKCITQGVWIKIRDGINQVVDSIMLATLINDYESVNEETL